MNKVQRITTISSLVVSLLATSIIMSSCRPGQLFGPTPTPIPTPTPLPIVTGIEGRVYFLDSKEPIPDATILLNNPQLYEKQNPDLTSVKTTTDSQGRYSFTDIVPGTYVISLQLVTKTRASVDFTVNTSKFLDSFEGTSEDGSTFLYIVEPAIEVTLGKIVQEDFVVH